MSARPTTLLAILLLGLALAACGSPATAPPTSVVPPPPTAVATATATVAPRATTASRPVPLPSRTGTACYPLRSSAPAPDRAAATPGATIAATALAVAPAADTRGLPLGAKTEFALGEPVCITYTLTNANPGDSLAFRFFRDGTAIPLDGTAQTFERGFASIDGVREFSRPEAGVYRVELVLNGAATPNRAITFTVR